MKKQFNRLITISLLPYLFFIIFGLFLFSRPDLANATLGIFLGIVIIISSAAALTTYIFNKNTFRIFRFGLFFSILGFLLGLFIVFNPLSFTAFLTLGLGIFLLLSGVSKFINALMLRKYKEIYWALAIVIALIHFAFGIIIIFNPFATNLMLTEFLGLFIVAAAILGIVEVALFRKNVKTLIKIK